MKFPVVSPKTMDQADNIVILGSGPSLDKTKLGIQQWKDSNNAIVIGAHYRFFVESTYTVFDTPKKFAKAQGKMAGKYLIGSRISKKIINPRLRDRILRIQYTPHPLTEWEEDKFYLSSHKIPNGGAGWDAVLISTFCKPKKVLIAGFDGYEVNKKGSMVVKHSMKSMINVGPKRAFDKFYKPQKIERYQRHERRRKELTYKIFEFLVSQGIQVYVFNESRLHGVDKDQIRDLGVHIL